MSQGVAASFSFLVDRLQALTPKTDASRGFVCVDPANGQSYSPTGAPTRSASSSSASRPSLMMMVNQVSPAGSDSPRSSASAMTSPAMSVS